MEQPTVPSVPDTVRAYARRFFRGDAYGWRGAPLTLVLFVCAMVLVVPVGEGEWGWPWALAGFAAVPAIDAVYREYQLGGTPLLILTAALTTSAIASVVLLSFFGVRLAFQGRLPIPYIDVVAAIALFGFLAAFLNPRGWQVKAKEAFEAEARQERARRGSRSID